MIEEVSHPPDLTKWNGADDRYYLELFGETQPLLDTQYAEVLPAGTIDGPPQTSHSARIYEYWWSIGHPGHKPHQSPTWRDAFSGTVNAPDMWATLREVDGATARVYLYFPINQNWRIKELVATLKYLSPTATYKTMWDRLADTWKSVSPFVDDASKLAALVPGAVVPGVSAAASVLSAMAKLQINSVPQEAIAWSVEKVTFGAPPHGVMQGIMWNLPQNVFTELGSRITGSIALSFIPCHIQSETVTPLEQAPARLGRILAHAVVYGPDGDLWSPGPDGHKFIELQIQPRVPSPGLDTP